MPIFFCRIFFSRYTFFLPNTFTQYDYHHLFISHHHHHFHFVFFWPFLVLPGWMIACECEWPVKNKNELISFLEVEKIACTNIEKYNPLNYSFYPIDYIVLSTLVDNNNNSIGQHDCEWCNNLIFIHDQIVLLLFTIPKIYFFNFHLVFVVWFISIIFIEIDTFIIGFRFNSILAVMF